MFKNRYRCDTGVMENPHDYMWSDVETGDGHGMGDFDNRTKERGEEEEREKERERKKHLCSQVIAGGQVLEAEQAVPLAGTSTAGIIVHHLKNNAHQERDPKLATSCHKKIS